TQVDHPALYTTDTLTIKVASTDVLENNVFDSDGFVITDVGMDNGSKGIYSRDVEFRIKPSENEKLRIEIRKESQGSSQRDSRNTDEAVLYDYRLVSGVLTLDNYLKTSLENGFRDEEVDVTIFLPSTVTFKLDHATKHYFNTDNNMDYGFSNLSKQLWKLDSFGTMNCVDCPNSNNSKPSTPQQKDTTVISSDTTNIKRDSI